MPNETLAKHLFHCKAHPCECLTLTIFGHLKLRPVVGSGCVSLSSC